MLVVIGIPVLYILMTMTTFILVSNFRVDAFFAGMAIPGVIYVISVFALTRKPSNDWINP